MSLSAASATTKPSQKKQHVPSPNKAQEVITKVDETRDNFVSHYTGKSRYDARNYDLVLNMDLLSEDEAVDLILRLIKK